MKHILIPAAAAAILALAVPAHAEQTAEFGVLMNEGVGYYKSGNYVKAIESFQKAQKIDPIPDITYNIAKSYQQLNDCDLALKYYREYALTSTENAQSVQGQIELLNSQCGVKMGSVTMKCTPSDTLVVIDNNTPVQCNSTYELKTGEHVLKFTAQNYIMETRTVDIQVNQPKNIVIEMRPIPNTQTAQTTTTSGQDNQSETVSSEPIFLDQETTTLFWAGIGSAAGGLVFAITGLSMAATSHREVSLNGRSGYYERSTPKLAGGVTLGTLGLAGMTAGAVLLVIDKFTKKKHKTTVDLTSSISVTPDSAAASLTMTF